MPRFVICVASVLAGSAVPAAMGARNPAGSGQPRTATPAGVWCPFTITMPQGFNSGGFAQATSVYANPGTTTGSRHAASEYDIACYRRRSHIEHDWHTVRKVPTSGALG